MAREKMAPAGWFAHPCKPRERVVRVRSRMAHTGKPWRRRARKEKRRRIRYPACDKLEIIQLVEYSHLPVRRTLVKLDIPRTTFYRWYDLCRIGGPDALGDRSSRPDRA